jgi:hypothetical protein
MILALLLFVSGAMAETPEKIDLAKLAANPRTYIGKQVTTCGWATNQFEDVALTVSEDREAAQGLEVQWCKSAPKTQRPTYQCLSGTIGTVGDVSPDIAENKPQDGPNRVVVIHNGSPFPWEIRQACSE